MSEFKVGDWVRDSESNTIFQYRGTIKDEDGVEWCPDGTHDSIFGPQVPLLEDAIHWQPKSGEWCIFYNDDMNFAVVGKFHECEEAQYTCVQYSYGNYESYKNCEPFIGTLPTFIEGK